MGGGVLREAGRRCVGGQKQTGRTAEHPGPPPPPPPPPRKKKKKKNTTHEPALQKPENIQWINCTKHCYIQFRQVTAVSRSCTMHSSLGMACVSTAIKTQHGRHRSTCFSNKSSTTRPPGRSAASSPVIPALPRLPRAYTRSLRPAWAKRSFYNFTKIPRPARHEPT